MTIQEFVMKGRTKVRLTDSACAKRAGVCKRTLRRWEEDPRVLYPKADLVLNRRYRWLDEVEEWEESNPNFSGKEAGE
jgi:hypothetical protein